MNPLISVIIPLYNHAKTIQQSLTTLYTQTYRPLEVILVNDGSTDGFETLVDALVKESEEQGVLLKVFHQSNKGAAAARNYGFQQAVGAYVIFWDADTMASPVMLEKMYQTLQSHPEASYAYCQFKFGWKTMKSQVFNEADLQKYNFIDTTSLIQREAVIAFDELLKRFQDWDMWLTLLEQGRRGIFIPEVLFSKKEERSRKGIRISNWLPSLLYKLPWKGKKVLAYEEARDIVLKKHGFLQ
jgi:glycosyltransferase involved in cell wall biosynthesis